LPPSQPTTRISLATPDGETTLSTPNSWECQSPTASSLSSASSVTSASQVIFGTTQWDPTATLDGFLTVSHDAQTRAGVFSITLGFSFAQVTTMIFANLISAGNHTAAMVPRFITYQRGAIICLIIGFAINP
jgi:cytosine/uracil/thiamine/allantoin permease